MNDSLYGTRDKRGNYTPNEALEIAPIYAMPPRPLRVLKWLFGPDGYLFPWNVALFVASAVTWFFLTPSMEVMATLTPGWITYILLRNMAMVLVLFGLFHLRLYIRKRQGNTFKYNPKFPEPKGQSSFILGSQTRENMFWTFCFGIPIWSAYEVLFLWAFASGRLPILEFAQSPAWFVGFFFLIPLWRELHFYVIHRLIHWGPLYHWIHKVHHNNVNPGPWSSLSMHPVEHLLYFSVTLIHVVIPSHPLHFLYTLQHAGLGSIVGHIGFDKVVTGEDKAMDTHAYTHYLHHKFFEVNYGDGTVPLDKVFGTFHDGTKAGDRKMDERRHARLNKQ
ncbi:sterol desaturase family protein [Celeribacter sp.]|uniref:sterol desaturase family protein n=1 Tax=Celeribacter sp. TaxID=1890673 RepID=UPI003A93C552